MRQLTKNFLFKNRFKLEGLAYSLAICLLLFVMGIIVSPYNIFFEYQGIKPEKEVYKMGEDEIIMNSIVTSKSAFDAKWTDTLRCRNLDGQTDYIFRGTFISNGKLRPGSYVSRWPYIPQQEVPVPQECIISAKITIYLLGFYPKSQLIWSDPFILK